MKAEKIAKSTREVHASSVLVVTLCCVAVFGFFAPRSLIPDVAWLIEASRRWMGGGELYRDVIEINPPLIFYEMIALTGGFLTPQAYVAGVCTIVAITALWVTRLRGSYAGFCALGAMLLGGLTDFGQRDHLALIFVLPFLVGEKALRRERIALGVWAFLGIGLKPYLVTIPVVVVIGRAILDKSVRSLVSAEAISLAVSLIIYVSLIAIVHPIYLNEIVPLGRFVYHAYGAALKPELFGLSVALLITVSVALLLKTRVPLALATLAALASFYLQGRNWSYHFVPAIGLGLFIALWGSKQHKALFPLAVALSIGQLARGPHEPLPPSPIPSGVGNVAVLSTHLWSSYPRVLELGIRNTTRYPALWTLPGAWNILNDPRHSLADRAQAKAVLMRERATMRRDIFEGKPKYIFSQDVGRWDYFNGPFDYFEFLGPFPGYRYVGRAHGYNVYARD